MTNAHDSYRSNNASPRRPLRRALDVLSQAWRDSTYVSERLIDPRRRS